MSAFDIAFVGASNRIFKYLRERGTVKQATILCIELVETVPINNHRRIKTNVMFDFN